MQSKHTTTCVSADGVTELEAHWVAPAPAAPVAVLSHHLPTMSNMHQRAIFATYKVLRARGWGVFRYNSRGVGLSAGEFSGGPGEDLDLQGAVAEARRRAPTARIALIGWSFGAERVLHHMDRDPAIAATVAVTPDPQGVLRYASGEHGPLLVIVAEHDQFFDLAATQAAFAQATEPKTWHLLEASDHFYASRRDEVAVFTVDWLDDVLDYHSQHVEDEQSR